MMTPCLANENNTPTPTPMAQQGTKKEVGDGILFMLLQLLMTGVAVLKVDDLGRKPLLIGGVCGIVCTKSLSLKSLLNLVKIFNVIKPMMQLLTLLSFFAL